MLSLDRPLGLVADLALFGDHVDPARVYYIPLRPGIATGPAGQELSLIRFAGEDAADGATGLLSFTTELTATEAQLGAALDLLRDDETLAEPQLVPVPWVAGKAVLAAAFEEGDGFVEQLFAEVTPDLTGSNRATFSARLSGEGAQLFEALLDSEATSPLGVRYELEYDGLRPALDVRLRADYRRVHEELSFGFQFGVAYEGIGVRAGVDVATQKLIENGAIQIEVLQFNDSAELQQRIDRAVQWFQNRVVEDFFKSSLQAPGHESLLDRAVAAATQLGAASLQEALGDEALASQIAEQLGLSPDLLGSLAGAGQSAGQGAGAAAGADSVLALKLQFTYRDIRQEELKTLTFDWTESHAERRTAAPQGLLEDLGASPTVIDASMSGALDRLAIRVRPLGDFEALGVQRVVVQLAYPSEDDPEADQRSFVFESGDAEAQPFAAWSEGRGLEYRSRTEVHFNALGAWPGPPIFVGDWVTRRSLDLTVHPLAELPRVEIEVSAGALDFAETSQAQVELRLSDGSSTTLALTPDSPSAVFRRRVDSAGVEPAGTGESEPHDGLQPAVQGRVKWFLAEGGSVQGDWGPIEGNAWLVGRPWKSQRTLRVVPLLPDDFIEATVTLTMSEGERTSTTELRFDAGERSVKSVSIPSLLDSPSPVRVDALVIRGDGSIHTAEPFETDDPVITIADREGVHRRIRVRLAAGESLGMHGLVAVQVQLLDAQDSVLDDLSFTESQRDPQLLLVPVEAGVSPVTRYRVVRYAIDGSAGVGPVQESSSAEVLVPAVLPTA